ncbi:MAG: PD40 domain-containing protein [Acidobacteriota bacterium]|nr:MAG: PD40 domain-containing protein [Acidobacteriota bacterium]
MLKQLLGSLFGFRSDSQPCSRLVFDRVKEEGPCREDGIYTINSDGTDCKQIYSSQHASCPAWAPDGKWIAFSYSNIHEDKSSILIMDENGDERNRLTIHEGAGASISSLTWSPDSCRLAYSFHEYVNGKHLEDIFVVNVNNRSKKKLTLSGENTDVVWTPSNELVFERSLDDDWGKLFVMGPNGENLREFKMLGSNATCPHWTPNGKKMVFGVSQDNFKKQYFVMNSDGSERALIPTNSRIRKMIISPDGQSVAYSTCKGKTFDVFILSLDDGFERRVVANSNIFSSRDISWSPVI